MHWNIISLGYVIYAVLILGYVFIYYHERFFSLLLGLLVGQVFIKLFHQVTFFEEMKRPAEACNCNIWNRGDSYGTRGGMPSGHVSMTTYLWVSLWFITGSDKVFAMAVLAIISMCLSRYYKRCHTPLQIMMGVVMGVISAHTFNLKAYPLSLLEYK